MKKKRSSKKFKFGKGIGPIAWALKDKNQGPMAKALKEKDKSR